MHTATSIVKHVARNALVKLLAFLLFLGCVGRAAYLVNTTAQQLVQYGQEQGDLLYQFDPDLEHSHWLYQQISNALYGLDDVMNNNREPSSIDWLTNFPGDYYVRKDGRVVTNNESLVALYENHTFAADSTCYLICTFDADHPSEWEANFPLYMNPSDILRGRDDWKGTNDTGDTDVAEGEDLPPDGSDSSIGGTPVDETPGMTETGDTITQTAPPAMNDVTTESDGQAAADASEPALLLLRVTPAQLEPYQDIWAVQQHTWLSMVQRVVYLVIIALLAFLYLLFVTGRVPADEDVHLVAIDHLPLELNGILLLAAAGVGIAAYIGVLYVTVEDRLYSGMGSMNEWDFLSLPSIVLLVAMAALVVELLLSQVRNFKNHTYVSQSLCLRLGSRFVHWSWATLKRFAHWSWAKGKQLVGWSGKMVKNVGQGAVSLGGKMRQSVQESRSKYSLYHAFFGTYRDRNVFLLFAAYSAGLFVLAGFTGGLLAASEGMFLFFLLLAGLLVLQGLNFLKTRLPGFGDIVTGVHRMREGELTYKIDAEALPEGVMRTLSEDINSLGEGMQTALQDAIRAERLKSELITNVSHDLKTPLTSILNYANLLCQEELSPEEANDYAQIIYQKGIRLKNLTSDLFDISKVQSGAETIEPERLDVVTLVQQTLAEQDAAITASGLLFKVTLPDHPVTIWADGKKMSRVLENLVNNCLKYALSGTRVFVSVWEPGNHTMLLEVKNIANYEMDFAADEITERFVRGDASRSTDGSGLGLAIAKSYTAACGGILSVETDGDLFKVKIVFPLCDD